jgi:hypothetical protein
VSNPSWPNVDVQVEFTSGIWTSLPHRVSALNYTRGRQYELAVAQAGVLNVTLENFDGALDPENAASPFYPYVKLGKRIRVMATWNGVTYPQFTGYVERWPQRWGPAGNGQWTDLIATDALGMLAAQELDAVFFEEVRRYQRNGAGVLRAWYPLDDQGGSSAGSNGGLGLPPGKLSYSGLTSMTLGSTTSTAAGNQGSNVAVCTGPLVVVPPGGNDPGGDTTILSLPPAAAPPVLGAWTVMVGFNAVTGKNNSSTILFLSSMRQDQFIFLGCYNGLLLAEYGYEYTPGAGAGVSVFTGPAVDDGKDHWLAVSLATDLVTIQVSLDGVQLPGFTAQLPAKAANPSTDPLNLTVASLGGGNHLITHTQSSPFTGTLAHYLCFRGDLIRTGQVASVFAPAYLNGRAGELTSDRFLAMVDTSPLGVPAGITAPGNSRMQKANTKGKNAALAAQDAAISENGSVYATATGSLEFVNRAWRYNPAPTLVFGERPGELPYTGMSIEYDLTHVANRVSTIQPAGVTVTAESATSQRDYGVRKLSQTLDIVDADQVSDAASYLLSVYSDPHSRVPQLVLDPASNPALWPAVLGTDLNTPVTVARRPGAGVSSSRVCWVEQVGVQINFESGTFTSTWQLSPADVNKYLVLDNTTLGTVDTVNRLAY